MSSLALELMSLAQLAGKVRNREVSPVAIADAYLSRIERLNASLKVYITVTGPQARASAQALEQALSQGTYLGPLHGIPFACKDVIWTRGVRTTGGSRVLEAWVPEHDAGVVEQLNRAGAILLGKANMHEFGHGATGENLHFGTVTNPWDAGRMAGGSSSGSAAAVANGLAAFALGTDTGGSVRLPAALCGIVGLKPTYGRVSCFGVIPYCWSLDHLGILSRTVEDAAIVLGAIAGHDARDPNSAQSVVSSYADAISEPVRGMRIGIPQAFFFDYLDSEIRGAVHRALGVWERLGAKLIPISMPPMEHTRIVSLIIQLSEFLSYHSRYLAQRAHLYGADVRAGLAQGQFLLAEHYVRAKRMVEQYRRQMAAVFAEVDLIITPACPIVAPPLGTVSVTTEGKAEAVGNALTRFTSFFNLTGHPAIALPCGLHSTKLPMGIQLVGRHFAETTLLRAAHAFEVNNGDVWLPGTMAGFPG